LLIGQIDETVLQAYMETDGTDFALFRQCHTIDTVFDAAEIR